MDDYKVNGEVVLDTGKYEKKINEAKDGAKKLGKEFEETATKGQKGFSGMTSVFLKANLASSAITKGLGLLKQGIGDVIKENLKLDKGLAKISTLTQGTTFQTANYKDELFKISAQTGIYTSELAEASYQALSAGVAVQDLGKFVAESAQLAKGGFTTTTIAVDTLTSVTNAYGKEMYTTQQISDKLITAQNLGKTTVGELGSALSAITPIASQMNISLDEVLGSVAALTKVGTPTTVAVTQVRSALADLMDSSNGAGQVFEKLTGETFPNFTKKGGTLAEALAIIKKESENTGVELATMFSRIEAGQGATALTSNSMNELKSTVEGLGNSLGATAKASELATDNISDQWDILTKNMTSSSTGITGAINTVTKSFLKSMNDSFKEGNEIDELQRLMNKRLEVLKNYYINVKGFSSNEAFLRARDKLSNEMSLTDDRGVQIKTLRKTSRTTDEVLAEKKEEARKRREQKAEDDRKEAEKRREDERQKEIQKLKDNIKRKEELRQEAINIANENRIQEENERKKEAEFKENISINEATFNTEQLQKKFNFYQAQQELRDQNKITVDEFNNNKKEFDNEQVIQEDEFRMTELQKLELHYREKEGMELKHQQTLNSIAKLKVKTEQDKNKMIAKEQKKEYTLNKTTEKFTRGFYRAIMNSRGNFLKDLGVFFKSFIAQTMVAHGEELAVKGTKDVLEGIALSSNPLTPGAGTALIGAGTAEIAQGLAWGGAGVAVGSIGGGDSGSKNDTYTSGATSLNEARLEDLNKEEDTKEEKDKGTVTYVLEKDSALYMAMLPGLEQAWKDKKNVRIVEKS